MKKLLRIAAWLLFAVLLLGASSLLYSTMRGYTSWFFRVNGTVTVDGRQTSGYLHANSQHTFLLVTRSDESEPETYLIPVDLQTTVSDCGKWHPIRFFPMPIGDLNPPCSVFTDPSQIRDAPIQSTLIRRRNSVEFSTSSGKKIRAEW